MLEEIRIARLKELQTRTTKKMAYKDKRKEYIIKHNPIM